MPGAIGSTALGRVAETGVGGFAAGGPVGAVAGAGLGVAGSLAESNQAKKARERAENRPKRRRLAKGMQAFQSAADRKERAIATLSSAVFDWAAALR
jgi:hypothetical protein